VFSRNYTSVENGLDIGISFQGLGKLFVDWVFFGINSQQQLPKIPLRKWIPPINLKRVVFEGSNKN